MSSVQWGRPVAVSDVQGEYDYTSKCGRWRIEKRRMSSARNGHYNAVNFRLLDLATGKASNHDRLFDAKDHANAAQQERTS